MPTPSTRLRALCALDVPAAIAHRGGSRLNPENTLAAFEHAISLGVDAIECDVHVSRDDEVVVIHDDTLDRTTDATGPVAARTADELARVDAGFRFAPEAGFPQRGRGIGVPRLSEVLARSPDVCAIVEIKGDRPQHVPAVLDVIRAAGAGDRVIVGGFSPRVLAAVRSQAPEIVTSASLDEVKSALRRSWFRLPPRRTGFDLFQIPFRFRDRQVLTSSFVRAIRRGGVAVQAWIVDEPEDMTRLLAWGVTGLISDRPDVALAVIREHAQRPR